MPLPTAILFTAALLTAVLAAIGWALDPAAPALGPWVLAKVTEGGLWSGLILFLGVVGHVAWRGKRSGASGARSAAARGREDAGPGE